MACIHDVDDAFGMYGVCGLIAVVGGGSDWIGCSEIAVVYL
jgi:hypothetical protein